MRSKTFNQATCEVITSTKCISKDTKASKKKETSSNGANKALLAANLAARMAVLNKGNSPAALTTAD